MSRLLTLPIKDPLERVPITFDFAADMAAADALATCAVAVEQVVAGADGSPNDTLDGVPALSGKRAVQWVRLGAAGATYRLRATATTSEGRTLVLRTLLPVATIT